MTASGARKQERGGEGEAGETFRLLDEFPLKAFGKGLCEPWVDWKPELKTGTSPRGDTGRRTCGCSPGTATQLRASQKAREWTSVEADVALLVGIQ